MSSEEVAIFMAVAWLATTVPLVATLIWLLVRERAAREADGNVISDLLARLASRSPEEYRTWTWTPEPPPPEPEPRIYDPTGLLSVPAEDRLED